MLAGSPLLPEHTAHCPITCAALRLVEAIPAAAVAGRVSCMMQHPTAAPLCRSSRAPRWPPLRWEGAFTRSAGRARAPATPQVCQPTYVLAPALLFEPLRPAAHPCIACLAGPGAAQRQPLRAPALCPLIMHLVCTPLPAQWSAGSRGQSAGWSWAAPCTPLASTWAWLQQAVSWSVGRGGDPVNNCKPARCECGCGAASLACKSSLQPLNSC